MKDFIVYHNPAEMNVDVEAVDAFSIVTVHQIAKPR